MSRLYFATTNKEKKLIAQTICAKFNINLQTVSIAIDEIQGEDSLKIVKDKAYRAYDALSKPVVVSDDSWDILALNGFPGPYMKSINYWFKPADFLRLMTGIEDRTFIPHQLLAYYDGKTMKVFTNDIPGKIINEPRGINNYTPFMSVAVLDPDNGRTVAEVFEQGQSAVTERYLTRPDVWHNFIAWFNTQIKK